MRREQTFSDFAAGWRKLVRSGRVYTNLAGQRRRVVKVHPHHAVEWERVDVSRSATTGVSTPRSWVEWMFEGRRCR